MPQFGKTRSDRRLQDQTLFVLDNLALGVHLGAVEGDSMAPPLGAGTSPFLSWEASRSGSASSRRWASSRHGAGEKLYRPRPMAVKGRTPLHALKAVRPERALPPSPYPAVNRVAQVDGPTLKSRRE